MHRASFFDHSPLVPVLPPPHQTIWSTFLQYLRIWPILCTQFMMMARVVVGSGGSDISLEVNVVLKRFPSNRVFEKSQPCNLQQPAEASLPPRATSGGVCATTGNPWRYATHRQHPPNVILQFPGVCLQPPEVCLQPLATCGSLPAAASDPPPLVIVARPVPTSGPSGPSPCGVAFCRAPQTRAHLRGMFSRAVLKGRDFFFLLRTALKNRPKGPPTANRQPPTATNRQPPTAANRQRRPTANCQPLPTATNHQPPITNHQSPTTNRHQPPVANCQPPTAANRQPPTATNHG